MQTNKDRTKTKLKLEPYQIILAPIVTEKGYQLSEHQNVYTFEVHKLANKDMIKLAVEELFEVKVVEVRVQNILGKTRRTRRKLGTQRDWKKAMVKLDAESKIQYF